MQSEFTEDDIWTEKVMEYLASHNSVGIAELLSNCIGVHLQDQTPTQSKRLGSIMRRSGWTRKQVRVNGKQVWRYFSHAVTTSYDTGDKSGDS